MITPKIIYEKIIGYPDRELGEEQPAKSLMAINQTQDVNGNYMYGFDLQKMSYNYGDVSNWFDERDDGNELLACFYLGTFLRPENSLVDEVDYFFQLVFKVPEDMRNIFQVFIDDFIKHQISNNFENDDHTREYMVEFTNGASVDYSEQADDDGADFLASIVITVIETNPINKFNDVKFYISDINNTLGENDSTLIKYVAYEESRNTSADTQEFINEPEIVNIPNNTDLDISFKIPAIRGNIFVNYIDKYRNKGEIVKLRLKKKNPINEDDNYDIPVSIMGTNVSTTGVGPIVYTVHLKRVKS